MSSQLSDSFAPLRKDETEADLLAFASDDHNKSFESEDRESTEEIIDWVSVNPSSGAPYCC